MVPPQLRTDKGPELISARVLPCTGSARQTDSKCIHRALQRLVSPRADRRSLVSVAGPHAPTRERMDARLQHVMAAPSLEF
jgi:hypothetical protein